MRKQQHGEKKIGSGGRRDTTRDNAMSRCRPKMKRKRSSPWSETEKEKRGGPKSRKQKQNEEIQISKKKGPCESSTMDGSGTKDGPKAAV